MLGAVFYPASLLCQEFSFFPLFKMLFIDPFDLCLQMGKISSLNMRKFNSIFPGLWVELEQQMDPLKLKPGPC